MRRMVLTGLVALVLAAAWSVWALLTDRQQTILSGAALAEADAQLSRIERDIAIRLLELEMLSRGFDSSPDAGSLLLIERELQTVLQGIRAVGFADTGFVLRGMTPLRDPAVIGTNLATLSPERATAFQTARDTRSVTMTPPLPLNRDGQLGFLAVLPVIENNRVAGYFVIGFEAKQWIDYLLPGNDPQAQSHRYAKRISFAGKVVYETDDFAFLDTAVAQSRSQGVLNNDFQVALRLRPAQMQFDDLLPELAALFIGGLSLLSLFAVTQAARARSAEARSARSAKRQKRLNDRLLAEVETRRSAEAAVRSAHLSTARFLATMSHEVRTPLNAIMGMFELIEASTVPDRVKRQAHAGQTAAQRLFSQLTNVLDASTLDAAAVQANPASLPLAMLVETWRDTLTSAVERSKKPLDVRVEVAPGLPETIMLDGDRVSQIVANLVDNAVKFTGSGTITLSVRAQGEILELSIADTGVGIPKALRGKVFQRFFQVENGLRRPYDGAGLGLSNCRELADVLGADLTVEEGPRNADGGHGSRFTLRLRAVAAENSGHGADTTPACPRAMAATGT
ncbi:ATP-binding protein [Mesobacterium sp. TK19101]|uniref:histidine kinase n=1 Tax=Mesobacterium hydrothermale TaxID=3111907 RepID=A0ABU6HJ36_9RHOB|nr:ATP-binding protein [Mesobacterium sp. TK19101]MEC3861921.1 ATP-binding protein [Mesobacterium sp. TK19101]